MENGRRNLGQKWVLLCIGASADVVGQKKAQASLAGHPVISAQCTGIFMSGCILGIEDGASWFVSASGVRTREGVCAADGEQPRQVLSFGEGLHL